MASFDLKCKSDEIFKCYQLPFYGIVLIIFLVYEAYFVRPAKGTMADVQEVSSTVQKVLSLMGESYYTKLRTLRPDANLPAIRINIMLRTERWFWARMKIFFHSGLPYQYSYSEPELALLWSKGEGACGAAWKSARLVIYGSDHPKFGYPVSTLPKRHTSVVGDRNSVLSVPIWSKFQGDKVVFGILNIDSELDLSKTLLDHDDVIKAIQDGIVLVSYVLSDFYSGVRL
jgi:hypothetical protein